MTYSKPSAFPIFRNIMIRSSSNQASVNNMMKITLRIFIGFQLGTVTHSTEIEHSETKPLLPNRLR